MSIHIERCKTASSCTVEKMDNLVNIVDIVRKASRDKNSLKCYMSLVESLPSPDIKDSTLLRWLQQLKDNISVLDKESEELVGSLLKISWVYRDESFIDSYQDLILNLVSAHTYYLRPVLQMLLTTFLGGKCSFSESDVSSAGEQIVDKQMFYSAHKLLKNIILLVPITPPILLPLLVECFPYMRKEATHHVCYVHNLLHMTTYMPQHRIAILELLLDKIIHIDVHCPKQEIEEAEKEKDETRDGEIFSMECEGTPVSNGQRCADDKLQNDSMHHQLANTLDLIMFEIFDFIDSICKIPGKCDLKWDATKKLYKDFLTVFDKLILTTHACSHVQYIMFYICSLKPALCEGFFDYLWKKIQSYNTAPVIRQVSAFYIGSLAARAKYIAISTVTACFDVMCSWIHTYINNHSGSSQMCLDSSVHGTFYAVCQTLFYIFAFRHKELIEINDGLKYLRSLNFERIVTCRLNPLKVCIAPVVRNFANVTRNYQLAYCYTIIEHNNRSMLPVVMQTSGGMTQLVRHATLDTFFPFDPYILKRSGKKIAPLYRTYEAHAEDERHSEDDDDSFLQDTIGTSPAQADIQEFLSYRTSPGFKKQFVSPKNR